MTKSSQFTSPRQVPEIDGLEVADAVLGDGIAEAGSRSARAD
jgi:hypothetical protein